MVQAPMAISFATTQGNQSTAAVFCGQQLAASVQWLVRVLGWLLAYGLGLDSASLSWEGHVFGRL